jgi:hypothetical protein
MTQDVDPASILYKYVTVAVLKKILEGTIRFTQPSAFNDPFELLPEIIVPAGEKERPINVSFDIRAQRQPAAEQGETIPDGYGSSDAMSRQIVHQLNQVIGILSLSKAKDSLLMWSHYADQYSGAVIAFDGAHDFFSDQVDIEYRSGRPRRRFQDYLAGPPIPLAELCVKSQQWAYEKEVRVVRMLAECEQQAEPDLRGFPIFVQRIPINAIKSVILGERTPVVEQREIFASVMDTNISLSLAAIDHSGFVFREEIIKFAPPISQMGPMMSPRTAHIFSGLQNHRGEFARWLIENHPMSRIVNQPI